MSELYNEMIASGESEIPYECECSNNGKIVFDYSIRHKFVKHDLSVTSGGGNIVETVTAEFTLPSILQCDPCGEVYMVTMGNCLLYEHVQQLKTNLFTGDIVSKPSLDATFNVDDLQVKLEALVDSINLEPKGKPTKI
tara:strand:- start:293 stop:706 length:414 start_codon:yes stop_codon:yes gene_type:complete